MKKTLLIIGTLAGIHVAAFGQSVKEMTNYSMSIFFKSTGATPAFTQSIKIDTGNNKAIIYMSMTNPANKHSDIADTSIVNAVTLAPIYHASVNSAGSYALHFNKNGITGYSIDTKTQKRTAVKETVNGALVDGSSLDYRFMKFPLALGFKKNFDVYNYTPGSASNISKVSIYNVESDMHTSAHFGDRIVWKVSLTLTTPEGQQRNYFYYVDKQTRRIWKYAVDMNGQNVFTAINNEDDYNPYHTKFDKEATIRLITNGKSVISGQAFARENDSPIKGMAIMNLNKKQVAQRGTDVILIPYTDFFKEWFEESKKAGKKGQATLLPEGAGECIKATKVFDNDGHFEFTNLMPGDYYLVTQFNMKHGASRTDVTGYTDTYINGSYQGTSANTVTHYFDVVMNTVAKKIVTIKQDGETVTVKLKQIQQ